MSWSNEFLEALQDRTLVPIFYLEVMRDPSSPGATGEQFFSHYEERLPLNPMIERSSVRVSSGAVSLLSWSKSFGGLTLGIHGGADESTSVLQSVVRGCLVRLFVGFPGWDYGDFQPVFTGQVTGLRGTPMRGYQLQCWDILRALGSRWTTTAGQAALFYNLRELPSTTVKAGTPYSIGNGTIDVTDASAFERETGGKYLLRVTGDTGGTFYLRCSGLSGTQFTIESNAPYNTTDDDAAAGNKVEHLALLQDGPIDIVKKLLISTGTGTAHATFDKYPAGWGWAVPLDWVDLADIDDVASRYQVDTTWDLDVVVEEAQTDPYSWLSGVIGSSGIWLVHRQGKISIRYAQNPFLTSPASIPPDFSITDMEIEQVLDWQAWDGSRQVEYQRLKVSDANVSPYEENSDEAISTLPSSKQYAVGLSHLWETASANNQTGVQDVDRRTELWAHRIPERCSVLLAGLAYAGLCEGDIGRLTSAVIPSRDPDGTMSRPCMVLSCQPDWLAGTVRLDLAIPPEWSTEFKT